MAKRPSALDSLVANGHVDKLKEEHIQERTTSKQVTEETVEFEFNNGPSSDEFLDTVANGDVIYHLDPTAIRPWAFADRPDSELVNIQDLADDIAENGQHSPILVRKLETPVGQIQYEYIYGNRRLSACRLLGIKIKAIVKDINELPDSKSFALMFGENEQREGISSWARSISFNNILSQGIFKSKRELSRAIGKNEGYIKDLGVYQRIPSEVANAIGSLTNVSQLTAKEIVSLSKDKQNIPALIDMAETIQAGASPASIRKKVLNRIGMKSDQKTYSGKDGEYFSISNAGNGFSVRFKKTLRKNIDHDQIAKLLIDLIDV